jgi:hypothetical protein
MGKRGRTGHRALFVAERADIMQQLDELRLHIAMHCGQQQQPCSSETGVTLKNTLCM